MDDSFNLNAPPPGEEATVQEAPKPFSLNEPPPEPKSQVEMKLDLAHKHYTEHAEEYFGRTSPGYLEERVPFVNIGAAIGHYANLSGAIKGMKSGNPSDEDINTLAQFKARQDYEAKKSGAGQTADVLTKVPALVAEFAVSGGAGTAVKEAVEAGLGKYMAEGLATKAAGYAANLATRTALTPSMYMDHAVNTNIEKDRDPLDPRGLPGAMGLALAQNAVLGEVGRLTGKAFTGNGLGQAVGRVAVQAASGPFAQAATDATTGFLGLSTGYGTGQMILDGKIGEAMQHAATDALTFAAFSVAHEISSGGKGHEEVVQKAVEKIKTTIDAQAKAGATPQQAAEVLGKEMQVLKAAVAKAKPPDAPTGKSLFGTDALTQEASPAPVNGQQAPKPYGKWPDADLVGIAKSLGMKKGETRAEAEGYLKRGGISEEILDQFEEAPKQAQVIQPEKPPAPVNEYGINPIGTGKGLTPEERAKLSQPSETSPPQAPEAAPVAPVEQSPVGKAFTEAFPGAQKHPERNEWKADFGGRTLYALHDPETGNVRIDFAWTGKAPEGAPTSGPKANIPITAQPESKAMLRKLGSFIDNLKKAGTGVEYTAQDGRADVYRRMMERAGFEQATGPVKKTEGTATYSWKPKTPEEAKAPEPPEIAKTAEVKSAFERMGDVVDQLDAARQEQRTSKDKMDVERKIQALENQLLDLHKEAGLEDVSELFEESGLTPREQHVLKQRNLGRSQKSIGADPEVMRLGRTKPYTRENIRVVEKAALEKLGVKKKSIDKIVRADEEAGAKQDAMDRGQVVSPTDLHVDPNEVKAQSRQPLTKGENLSNQWMAYYDKLENHDEFAALSPADVERLKGILGARFKEGPPDESPAQLLRAAHPEANREHIEPPSVRSEDSGLVQPHSASGAEAPTQEVKGSQGLGGSANAGNAEAAGNKLTNHPALEDIHSVNKELAAGLQKHLSPAEVEQADQLAREQVSKEAGVAPEGLKDALLKPDQPAGSAKQPGPGEPGTAEPITGGQGFGRPVSPAERAGGSIGGGQPNAGEGTPEQPRHDTALANAVIDKELVARGKEPLMSMAAQANPEVWAKAMAVLDKDPMAGRDLVEKFSKQKDAIANRVETALVLHTKVAVENEHERSMLEVIKANKPNSDTDAITREATWAREAELNDKVIQVQRVARDIGSEAGGAFQFRKQLVAQDFSLGKMLMEASVAKGRPLEREERLKIAEQAADIKKLQEKLAEAEAGLNGQKMGTKAYRDFIDALTSVKKAQGAFKDSIQGDRDANKGYIAKVGNWFTRLHQAFVISNPITFAKIAGASAWRLGITPVEEAIGAGLSQIPGIQKIADAAPRQGGGSLKIEGRAFASAFTKGLADAWKTLPWNEGKSDLDIAFGNKSYPRGWLGWVAELHAVLKAPAVRAEFTRSYLKRVDHALTNGQDATSPAAVLRIGEAAYKDSQAAKFQQDSVVIDGMNKGLAKLKAETSPGPAQALGHAIDFSMPVRRVPWNMAMEVAQTAVGTATGSVRAALAFRRGLENVPVAQRELIMQDLKKGLLGAAALAIGFYNRDKLGGFYSGKRKEGDEKAEEIGGAPASAFHHPLLEVMQMGATIGRASEEIDKKTGKKQGLGTGLGAGAAGLAEKTPFVREAKEVKGLTDYNAKERGYYFGEFAKSLAVPQLVQWLAGQTDKNAKGEPIKRKPVGVGQHIEMGVPGLRQTVPAK